MCKLVLSVASIVILVYASVHCRRIAKPTEPTVYQRALANKGFKPTIRFTKPIISRDRFGESRDSPRVE